MTKLVTIFGGSGFVGRYIVRRIAKEGWRVRVATRDPNEALFVKPYGAVGQVEPFLCNIRDDASVRNAMVGADAVVNCVGILKENRKNTFEAIQSEGAERVARIASELNIENLVHLSAIGADDEALSEYSRTKAAGEKAVKSLFPNATILRPSVVFGPEDDFFNRFAGMSRFGPVLPIAGGTSQFQPVYVDDVALAAVKGIKGEAAAGVYELGGPDTASLSELVQTTLGVIRRRRLVLNLPMGVAKIAAFFGNLAEKCSFGIIKNPATSDQLKSLSVDNVVSAEAMTLTDLGITPRSMKAILPDYLWRFRPTGQYDAIKESAQNLKS